MVVPRITATTKRALVGGLREAEKNGPLTGVEKALLDLADEVDALRAALQQLRACTELLDTVRLEPGRKKFPRSFGERLGKAEARADELIQGE